MKKELTIQDIDAYANENDIENFSTYLEDKCDLMCPELIKDLYYVDEFYLDDVLNAIRLYNRNDDDIVNAEGDLVTEDEYKDMLKDYVFLEFSYRSPIDEEQFEDMELDEILDVLPFDLINGFNHEYELLTVQEFNDHLREKGLPVDDISKLYIIKDALTQDLDSYPFYELNGYENGLQGYSEAKVIDLYLDDYLKHELTKKETVDFKKNFSYYFKNKDEENSL